MLFSGFNEQLELALQSTWSAIYAKFLAVILLYGATVHVGNILGLTRTPWLSTPLLWRVLDILLLCFNGVAAIALWQRLTWSIWFVLGGMVLLQWIPYTLWRSHFILKPEDAQTLNGLIAAEVLLCALFAAILWISHRRVSL